LLDELVRQMPEGVFLKSVKQKGPSVDLVGYAQSNARVSTLMRNIESSPWLANPNLIEIKAATLGKMRVSEFNLKLGLKRPTVVDSSKDAAKAAPKPAPAKKG
jgi:type IV pilus assembly protein PilN